MSYATCEQFCNVVGGGDKAKYNTQREQVEGDTYLWDQEKTCGQAILNLTDDLFLSQLCAVDSI